MPQEIAIASTLLLLLISAWRDIATRTIPNFAALCILVLGLAARMPAGKLALLLSAGTAALLFVLLLIPYSCRAIGGGDIKIITAVAVGLPPIDTYRFIVATALAGGLLGVAYLLLYRRRHKARGSTRTSAISRVMAVEAWRISRRGPLPYGVAIAIGGAFVLLRPAGF